MRVLIACEFSGIVREAFKAKGHDAWSCDILDTEIPGQHIKDDVLKHLDEGWDLMIAHPPCTYLSNAGARWLFEKDGRWALLREAAEFFNKFKSANIPRIAIENPQPHKYATELIGHYDMKVQPWWFGDGYTKGVCLWLKNLPPLMATLVAEGRIPQVHHEPPGINQAKNRSRTYHGIAKAMAEQWGQAL